jgi:general secretion pathway protein D
MMLTAACFMLPELARGARISGDQGVVESSGPAVAPLGSAVSPQSPSQNQESLIKKAPSESTGREVRKLQKDSRYVTIDFDNVDIGVFVKFVSELTGKNFVIDEKVKGKVTVISPKKIRVDEVYKVFESVLEVNGFATVPSGDIIKVVPALQAREKSVETLLGSEGVQPEDKIVTQIITLEYANTEEIRKILEPLISRNSVIQSYPPTGMIIVTDIQSNIKRLQQIVDALDVQGVGEQLTYVPLQFATARDVSESLTTVFTQLKGIAPIRVVPDDRNNSLIVIATEDDTARVKQLISLMDKEVPRAGANLHVYRLQNAVAEDLAKVLMSLPKDAKETGSKGKMPVLSKDVQIVADKPTNTLIITADRGDYQLIDDVIKKLDVPRPMVYIEALIMEVSVTKNFSIGVEWRGIKDTGHISGFDTGESAAFVGSGGLGTGGGYNIIPGTPTTGQSVDFPGGFSVGVLGAGISIGGVLLPNIGAVLQAYRNDDDVSILSTPQLLTMDNEEAEINVGENIPYVTRKETSTTSLDYSTYEYKDVGVILNITPHISEDNYVRLKMNQQVTKVVTAQSTVGLPTTLKRAAKTTVVVKDNETVVIGGMIGDNTEDTKYSVPWLSSIPLIGWLFKSKSSTQEKTNLFIFVTPHIIRTHKDVEALYKEKRGIIGEVEGGVIKMHDNEPGAAGIKKSSSGDKDGQ